MDCAGNRNVFSYSSQDFPRNMLFQNVKTLDLIFSMEGFPDLCEVRCFQRFWSLGANNSNNKKKSDSFGGVL